MDWLHWTLSAVTSMFGVAVALLAKMVFNHMSHLRQDIQELRLLFIRHLEEHNKG